LDLVQAIDVNVYGAVYMEGGRNLTACIANDPNQFLHSVPWYRALVKGASDKTVKA
jgi:hypothetical protein